MDNYQEWDNPPIILKDSKPIISSFITEYHFFHYLLSKLIYLILFCTFRASTITRKAIILYILKWCSRQSPLHLTLYPTGSINHASATPRNNAIPVMVVGNSPKIIVQAKNCGIMSRTVNLEDIVVNTHS